MTVSMLFLQLIPVRKIGLIIQGFSYIVFATDIQLITVRNIITFITESCLPEAYCHHKCPMGCAYQAFVYQSHISGYVWKSFIVGREPSRWTKSKANQPHPHYYLYKSLITDRHFWLVMTVQLWERRKTNRRMDGQRNGQMAMHYLPASQSYTVNNYPCRTSTLGNAS